MDIDLELDYADRISGFLRSKLQEIKAENSQLQSSLKHRQEVASKYRAEIVENNSQNFLKITEIWKKIVDGKYVLGLELRNESESTLNNFTVTLDWSSSSPLAYKFHLISTGDALKFTPNLTQSGQILIILDVPLFTDHLSYTLCGSLTFNLNLQKITVNLPSVIVLKPQDVTDNSNIVDLGKVIDGSNNDFVALASTGQKYEFVVIVPANWGPLLENVLEIDCNLRRVPSKTKVFMAHKICPVLDGVLLEIDENDQILQLNTYCKDLEVTTMLLHFLHTRISDVNFIPKPLYQADLGPGELSGLVKISLCDEIDDLEKVSRSNWRELRGKMTDLEHRTDILITGINKSDS